MFRCLHLGYAFRELELTRPKMFLDRQIVVASVEWDGNKSDVAEVSTHQRWRSCLAKRER